jgi:hypothetical protein
MVGVAVNDMAFLSSQLAVVTARGIGVVGEVFRPVDAVDSCVAASLCNVGFPACGHGTEVGELGLEGWGQWVCSSRVEKEEEEEEEEEAAHFGQLSGGAYKIAVTTLVSVSFLRLKPHNFPQNGNTIIDLLFYGVVFSKTSTWEIAPFFA